MRTCTKNFAHHRVAVNAKGFEFLYSYLSIIIIIQCVISGIAKILVDGSTGI